MKLANIELIKIKNYLNIFDDAKKTSTYLKEKDILIVDGYKFSNKWISILKKKKINIFLNNDLEKKFITTTINPSDTYINFKKNKFGIPLIKRNFLIKDLEHQYLKIKKSKKIFLCLGGSDKENYSEKILDIINSDQLKNFEIQLVLGELNNNFNYLKKKFIKNKNLKIIRNTCDIRNLYSNSALCILAGGVMSREALCFGIPGIVFKISNNQQKNINFYKRKKLYDCYDVTKINKIDINIFRNKLLNKIREFTFEDYLQNISYSSYDFFERYLFLLTNKKQKLRFKLKKISWSDFIFLFNLANQNRNFSILKKKINILEHYKWFKKKIISKNSKNYILYLNDIKLGQIRLDKVSKNYYIDYSIDKFYQGNGYGKIIIKLLLLKLKNTNHNIYAKVLNNNLKSKKIFNPLFISYKESLNKKILTYKLK